MTAISLKPGGTTIQASPDDGYNYIDTERSDNLTATRSQRWLISRKGSDESEIEYQELQTINPTKSLHLEHDDQAQRTRVPQEDDNYIFDVFKSQEAEGEIGDARRAHHNTNLSSLLREHELRPMSPPREDFRDPALGPLKTLQPPGDCSIRKLMLSWQRGKPHRYNDRMKLTEYESTLGERQLLPPHVMWLHSKSSTNSLESLRTILQYCKLPYPQNATMHQLLDRVGRDVKIHSNGWSLNPTATRYDLLGTSQHDVSQHCIFLSFPYFLLDKSATHRKSVKEPRENAVRTLLQSHYRYHDTAKQDDRQSIKILDDDVKRMCIDSPSTETYKFLKDVGGCIIHVPELWATFSSEHLVTLSCIGETELAGSEIEWSQKPAIDSDPQQYSVVRINFALHGKIERVCYPIEHCGSWFDLLNKYYTILRLYYRDDKQHRPNDLRIFIGEDLISETTWVLSQRPKHMETQILDVWLKSLQHKDPYISVGGESERQEPVSVVLAFLGWPALDEAGKTDSRPMLVRVKYDSKTHETILAEPRGPGAPSKMRIRGRSEKEANNICHDWATILFFQSCRRLLRAFVPRELGSDLTFGVIQVFWGAVYELIENDLIKSELRDAVRMITRTAERIHLGVQCRRSNVGGAQLVTHDTTISRRAVLLTSILDSFEAILKMLLEAVKESRQGHSMVTSRYATRPCEILERSKKQIILQADEDLPFVTEKSCLSPEKLVITILERLVHGVFSNKNIDVIGVYKACLENIKLGVKIRTHRHVFQGLRAIEEELAAVHSVLLQQQECILEFRHCLDPSSFTKHNASRRSEFESEEGQIERISGRIHDQIKACQQMKKEAADLYFKLEPPSNRSFAPVKGETFIEGFKRRGTSVLRSSKRLYDSTRVSQRQDDYQHEYTQFTFSTRSQSSEKSSRPVIEAHGHGRRSLRLRDESEMYRDVADTSMDLFQELFALKGQDVRAAAFKLLWDKLPRIDLEGKVGNFEDPGDGQFYDEQKIQQASSVLNTLCRTWESLGDRVASACPATLSQMARICLILNGMQQPSLLYDFIDHNITDTDLPLSHARLDTILRESKSVYVQVFVTEQYRAIPRVWPAGSHVEIPEAEPLPLAFEKVYAEGSYGSVSRVRDLDSGKFYALKRQIMVQNESMNSDARNHLHHEAMQLRTLSHKHIVQLVKSFRRGDTYGLLLNPAATSDLQKLLHRFHRDKFNHVEGTTDSVWLRPVLLEGFGCLSNALSYMHKTSLRHKDIKPSNILYEKANATNEGARLLLADFGLAYDFSKTDNSNTRNVQIFSKRYAAPELMKASQEEVYHGRPSDVFSLGCVFFEILAALKHTTLPIDMLRPVDSKVSEVFDQERSPFFCNYLSELVDWTKTFWDARELAPLFVLATNMVEPNPLDRPTMDHVLEHIAAAGSDFFCSSCWSQLSPQGEPSLSIASRVTARKIPSSFAEVRPATNQERFSSITEMKQRNSVAGASADPINDFKSLLPSTLEDIGKSVSQNCPKSGIKYNVTFVLRWDLIRYVEQELSGSNPRSQSNLLSRSLAITGTAQAAYAATVNEYLKWRWPQNHTKTIQLVFDSFQTIKTDQLSKQSASVAENDVDHSKLRISVEDTQEHLIGLAGQLAWLAAVCRVSEFNQASYSQISFTCSNTESKSFEIIPLPLQKIRESDAIDSATCWLPIFRRGIIAHGFPIPDRQAGKGIELPFSLMTDQAGILYPVKYKGRIYLRGFSCILFPTSVSDNSQSVQWHLIYSGDSSRRLSHDTLPSSSKASGSSSAQWLKTTNIKGLSTSQRTFLGYCKHVEVHLCTEQGSINCIQVSGARTEKHRLGLLLKSITASAKEGVGVAFGADIIRSKGLADEANERRLQPLVDEATHKPVILYDTASDRAWLVPTISVILLMIRIYASRDQSLLAKVRPATSSWDAATEAMRVIRAVEGIKLPKEMGESDERHLSEFLHDLLVSIDKKIVKDREAKHDHKADLRIESSKLYGWELLDIVRERRAYRKQIRCSADWTRLANEVLVLFGRDFGDIIRPASDSRVCEAWNPLPAKRQYLSTTVKCLQDWSHEKWGTSSATSHCLKILDEAYWQPEASLFSDCHGQGAIPRLGPCYCTKKPQRLTRHAQPLNGITPPPNEGGIIFGPRKLRKFPQKLGKFRLNDWHRNGDTVKPASGHAMADD